MTILERPYDYNWSKNDIRYVLQPEEDTTSVQLRIKYANSTGNSFSELITLSDLAADTNGRIYVYIQAYLNSLLSYTVPQATQFILRAPDECNKFYIEYREITDDEDDPEWVTSESDHICYVLKGGVETLKASGNNFFVNYFAVSKPFLTWLPSNRFVYADQYAFLTFLNTGATAVGYKLKFTFTDVAGNTYHKTIVFAEEDRLFHLNVSPANDDFPVFTDPLYCYDVKVTTHGNVDLTETYRFYVEYRPVYEYWDLFWHNSLGGFDGSRVVGETTITIEKNYTENGAGKDVDAGADKVRRAGLLHTAIIKRNSFKGDIGFQKNTAENEALQEILLSSSIYQLLVDLWLPVLNVQKTQDLRTSKSKMFSFPIQWQLASEEEVYTPKIRSFGIGTNIYTPYCSPVGIGDYPGIDDLIIGEPFSISIPLTGEGPFAIVSTDDMPDGLSASIVGDALVISGTPTAEGTDLQITVVISNCEDDHEVTFSDTINVTHTATHWREATGTGGDANSYFEDVQIQGTPDETVTIEVTTLTNDFGATITFDGDAVTVLGQTFTKTLTSLGLSDTFHLTIDAGAYPGHSYGIVCKFTITAATGLNLGTPLDHQISKVIA